MNKVVILLISMVMGTTLYADNGNSIGFLGLELGAASVQGDILGETKHSSSYDIEYGLRIGAQNDEWRTTFVLDYYSNTKDDQTTQKGLGMVDYFFVHDREMMFKPFIGFNAGYGRYETTQIDSAGFLYGGQAGVVVSLENNIDLDLSYRYTLMLSDIVNDLGTIVFGFNYVY